jgi:dihydrofolate reductase
MKIIVACDRNGGIGFEGGIPWKNKDDLSNFARVTKSGRKNAVIMGRKTWESLPHKLKDRRNIVISRGKVEGVECYRTIYEAERAVENYDNVFCIGGGQIYSELLKSNRVDEIYLSVIKGDYVCDTFIDMSFFKKFRLTKLENRDTYDYYVLKEGV